MDDVFLTAKISDTTSVCISPLPDKTYKETGAKGLGGKFGYFIYEVNTSRPSTGIEVIGKTASLEAALRMFEIICGKAVPVES
jgi:hypothetical protein